MTEERVDSASVASAKWLTVGDPEMAGPFPGRVAGAVGIVRKAHIVRRHGARHPGSSW